MCEYDADDDRETCGNCGGRVLSRTTVGPGETYVGPCGCRVAADGGYVRAEKPNWRDYGVRPKDRCRGCGNTVPDVVARVHGDNDGCVDHCPECIDELADADHSSLKNWSPQLKRASAGVGGDE